MSLWIFGDSFSVSRQDINKGVGHEYPLWTDIVTNSLGLAGYYNYSQWGVSNEYILMEFQKYLKEMQSDDCVIIQLTHSSRQWFFKEYPELSNYYVTDIESALPKPQYDALQKYITYLHRTDIDHFRYSLLVLALQQVAQMLKPIKLLILPGFHNFVGVNGTLMDICDGEFTSAERKESWYKEHKMDPRPNHMLEENHAVLGNKISDYFLTGRLVDLTTGFKKDIL